MPPSSLTKFKNSLTQKDWKLHLALVCSGWIFDQITKIWAVNRFSLEDGHINTREIIQVFGEWLQFRLVYNPGAAFGMQPQKILPFLHPTLFYGFISLAALAVLLLFYSRLPKREKWTHVGVALITAGALGNLTDRLRLHKVIDFIDAEFIDISVRPFQFMGLSLGGLQMERWPTFNLADSYVCVGVAIIFAASFFQNPNNRTRQPVDT